jgi:hypothetical protein
MATSSRHDIGQRNRQEMQRMKTLTDKAWHPLPGGEVVQFLGVNSSTGLSAEEERVSWRPVTK